MDNNREQQASCVQCTVYSANCVQMFSLLSRDIDMSIIRYLLPQINPPMQVTKQSYLFFY